MPQLARLHPSRRGERRGDCRYPGAIQVYTPSFQEDGLPVLEERFDTLEVIV